MLLLASSVSHPQQENQRQRQHQSRHRRRHYCHVIFVVFLFGILPMVVFQWQQFSSLSYYFYFTSLNNVTLPQLLSLNDDDDNDIAALLPLLLLMETSSSTSSSAAINNISSNQDTDDDNADDHYYEGYLASLVGNVNNEIDFDKHDEKWKDALEAFRLALQRAQQRRRRSQQSLLHMPMPTQLYANLKALQAAVSATTTATTTNSVAAPASADKLLLLNLIRIPKAGSSALSITARALVGCAPDGYPCCGGGNTKNSTKQRVLYKACPRDDLWCPAIRGCLDHMPDYSHHPPPLPPLPPPPPPGDNHDNDTQDVVHSIFPTITTLRHPVSRALSAFFYRPPHRPRRENHTMAFFEHGFMKLPRYQNPMTKMLCGYHAYHNHVSVPPAPPLQSNNDDDDKAMPIMPPISVDAAKKRLCQLDFVGLAEMPMASALLLYETHPFDKLRPNPVAFGLPPKYGYHSNNNPTVHVPRPPPSAAEAAATAAAAAASLQQPSENSTTTTNNRTTTTPNIIVIQKTEPKSLIRQNNNRNYIQFKTGPFVQHNGTAIVHKYQAMDLIVYDFAAILFCQRLQLVLNKDQDWIGQVAHESDNGLLSRHFEPCRQVLSQQQQEHDTSAAASTSPLEYCADVLQEQRNRPAKPIEAQVQQVPDGILVTS